MSDRDPRPKPRQSAGAGDGEHPAPRRRRGGGRERILEAALEQFAARGFEAVSTSDIARQAHTSQSVVLYHFGTKENLWQEAMRLLFNRVDPRQAAASPEAAEPDAPLERLKGLLRRFVLVSARHPELGQVIFREGAAGGERLEWLLRELAGETYAYFAEALESAVRAGLIRPHDPVQLTLMLHGAGATLFNLPALSRALLGRSPFDPEVIDRQVAMVTEILLGGLLATDARRTARPTVTD